MVNGRVWMQNTAEGANLLDIGNTFVAFQGFRKGSSASITDVVGNKTAKGKGQSW